MRLLKSQLAALPKRFTNALEKRREENQVKFNLSPKEAEEEALQHVGRLVYLWQEREKNRKAQIPLFANTAKTGKRGVADA